MKKPIALLPAIVLALVGCSGNTENSQSHHAGVPSASDPVVSDSAPRDIAESSDVALTFVSLKVPNMV